MSIDLRWNVWCRWEDRRKPARSEAYHIKGDIRCSSTYPKEVRRHIKIFTANKNQLKVSIEYYIMGHMVSQITSFTNVYSIIYSGADQRKHQSSSLTVEFPAQRVSNTENVSVWRGHHASQPLINASGNIFLAMLLWFHCQCSTMDDMSKIDRYSNTQIYKTVCIF